MSPKGIFAARCGTALAAFLCSLSMMERDNVLAQPALSSQDLPQKGQNSLARVPIVPDQWPWSSIGRVNFATALRQRTICTGTLVGPRTVITAAHCLFDVGLNQWVQPTIVHFVAGLSPGARYSGESAVSSYFISPDYRPASGGQPPDFQSRSQTPGIPMIALMAKNDWAVLTLEGGLNLRPLPIQSIWAGNLPGAEREAEVALPGYGADRKDLLAISRNCAARTDLPELGGGSLAFTCEIAKGGSGSPVLLLKDQAAVVVGIATAAPIMRADLPARGGIGVSASAFEQAVSSAIREAVPATAPSRTGQNAATPSGGADQSAASRKAERSVRTRQPKAEVDDGKEKDRKLNICRGC